MLCRRQVSCSAADGVALGSGEWRRARSATVGWGIHRRVAPVVRPDEPLRCTPARAEGDDGVKLHDHFAGRLQIVVNINPHRLQRLESHVGAISGYVREDSGLSSIVEALILQGSWAHRTILKPLPGQEFDADVLVKMRKQRAWSADPQHYLQAAHQSLGRSGRYRDRITLKTRCVRVSYAGRSHLFGVRGPDPVARSGRGWMLRWSTLPRWTFCMVAILPGAGLPSASLDRDADFRLGRQAV